MGAGAGVLEVVRKLDSGRRRRARSHVEFTRQSLKVDPRGPAISNLLHPYLLLPRTRRARVTKSENGHEIGRQGTDCDENQ